MAIEIPLPWERLLWSGRAARPGGHRTRYVLSDFRLIRIAEDQAEEVALHDITDVQCSQSRVDRLFGTRTVIVSTRHARRAMVLHGVRQGLQLSALLDILSGEAHPGVNLETVKAMMAWDPQARRLSPALEPALGVLVVVIAVVAVFHILHTPARAATIAADDPIAPGGHRRSRAEIAAFMEQEVMPWARTTFAPLKGGADRVTCATCHGSDADARAWRMPAVAALPQPALREQGWERYSSGVMDSQMRNAIYGYLANAEKQSRAGYMRAVVMPGMAELLHRPPYDFTQPYAYNRERAAFGCYHCHRID